METFISAQPDPPNIDKVEKLIKMFNKEIIKRLSGASDETGAHLLNTTLDNAPDLTPEEFSIARNEAKLFGYTLESRDDNYDSVTYVLNKS